MFGPADATHYFSSSVWAGYMSTTAKDAYQFDFWVYMDSINTYPTIFNTGPTNTQFCRLLWYADGTLDWTTGTSDDLTAAPVTFGTCNHIVGRWDSATGYKDLWVNGNNVLHVQKTGTWIGVNFTIGYPGLGGQGLTGHVQKFILDDLTPVGSATPTPTNTNTPVNTPTPGCMAKFTPYTSNPIFTPVPTVEENCNAEPSVIPDGSTGTLLMSMLSNWTTGNISTLWSTDALHWTKIGSHAVIGTTYGGETGGASRGTFLKVGSDYRIYYILTSTQDLYFAKTTTPYDVDSWVKQTIPVALHNSAGLDQIGMVNTSFWQDGSSDTWYGVFELHNSSAPNWTLALYKSVDNGLTFAFQQRLPSLALPSGPYANGIYNAADLDYDATRKVWHLWITAGPLAILPEEVFHASSFDLMNWNTDTCTVASLADNAMGIVPEQISDPSKAIEWQGKTYLYYDATDNANSRARIGVSIYNGTKAQLYGNPVPSKSGSIYLRDSLKLRLK
jgi:hypothetical protein